MRLDDSNDIDVEDQRGGGGGFGLGGGGLGSGGFSGGGLGGLAFAFLPMLFSRLGCFGTAIVVGLFLFFSGGIGGLGGLIGGGQQAVPSPAARSAAAGSGAGGAAASCSVDAASRFSCNALASVNATWAKLLPGYTRPRLVFYSRNGQSGCGAAQSAMGPFYCPADQGVYLDTEFYDELQNRFKAGGDFAQAYVIAHEVGHHVQKLSGVADKVAGEQQRVGRTAGNALQVKMELQADCYAGVWAANNRDRLDPGDVEEGMRAAQAIGDDTLQQEAQGRVVPESFTHGSSAQRQFWLKRGLDSGDPNQCDTFAAG